MINKEMVTDILMLILLTVAAILIALIWINFRPGICDYF